MKAIFTDLVELPSQPIPDHHQRIPSTAIGQSIARSMMRRYTCPCCSDVLLRHVRSGELYWRCNSCYQEMPV